MDKYFETIKRKYESGDFVETFKTIMEISKKIGFKKSLKYLERCVTEKRLRWIKENLKKIKLTGDPIEDAYNVFYVSYLKISCPKDGEIVRKNKKEIITRWHNKCPILDACKKLGLDTKIICKEVYHRPSQVFLSKIDKRLKFDRNYNHIRPYTPYCEEIIRLEKNF